MPNTPNHILHTLWGKAVGTDTYDKKEWLQLDNFLLQSGVQRTFEKGFVAGRAKRDKEIDKAIEAIENLYISQQCCNKCCGCKNTWATVGDVTGELRAILGLEE